MPIYEFYCARCHTLFNFFSARIDTESRPLCPRCGEQRLERRPAAFATLKHRGEEGEDPLERLDDADLDGALESLTREMGDAEGDEDPRKLAALLRRFGEAAGLEAGPRMEEMLSRLEAGEDPDALEEEMGDDLGDDSFEEFFRLRRGIAGTRSRRPRVDETLYFL